MSKSLDSTAIQIILILAVAILIFVIYPQLNGEKEKPSETNYLYDTDPSCNDYIKGRLEPAKLDKLDKILLAEKKNSGLRLSLKELAAMAANDAIVMDAYARWRKCKDMMRSYHRVVYPDERSMVQQ